MVGSNLIPLANLSDVFEFSVNFDNAKHTQKALYIKTCIPHIKINLNLKIILEVKCKLLKLCNTLYFAISVNVHSCD